MIGQRIGQYEILEEIGRGGMGTVYRARQLSLNRDVALKILPSHLSLDPTGVERFRREAMAVAQLAHPNIVQVHDIGEDGGVHFIAMEYVRGRTAAELLKAEGPLAFRKALEICAPVAAALGVAHKAGIVHRDVKPSNILVSEAGFAKLADFGVAGLMQPPEGERLTMTGAAVGTPYYMSPEQVRGREALDGASDVYSLGVVLYELLSGVHPFGDATPTEAFAKQMHEPFPPIRRYRPDIPDELEQVLVRCLAKNRAERFQNGEELCQALEKVRLRLGFEESESGEDYRKRVSGTGFFYVDDAQKREAKAAVGLRALGREMVAQVRDPNKRQRRALQALYTQSVLAREDYKGGEGRVEELRKRQKHHQDKAAQHRAQAQKLIAEGKAEEAAASAEKESACEKLALDYAHQAEELGKQVAELRNEYDRRREAHGQAADELALLDAEARRAGKRIPVGAEAARLSRQARFFRHALSALLVLLALSAGWWALKSRPHPQIVSVPALRPTPVVAHPPAVKKPRPVPKDGLVLYYTFDEDNEKVRDQSGQGHDAHWVGTPQYDDGIKGKAPRFRSRDTYLVAAAPELNMNGWKGMSVSLWVSSAGHTLYGHVINRGPLSTDTLGTFELAIGHGYGKGVFVVQNNPTNLCPTVSAGPGNLPLNQWCHLVGTYDGERMRYYIDGKLEKETRLAASPTPLWDGPDTKLVIGNMSRLPFINWTDMFFNGWVDEVRIYNRALSPEEIVRLHDEVEPPAPSPPARTGGPILHYTFDKDEGGVVTDQSGTGHNGTVHGATWTPGGRIGGAYDFNGNGDYIDTGCNLSGLDEISVCGWVRPARAQRGASVVTQFGGPASDNVWGLFAQNDHFSDLVPPHKCAVGVLTADGRRPVAVGKPSLIGQWTHLCFTFKRNGKLVLYKDGAAVGQDAVSDSPLNKRDSTAKVGASLNADGYWANGLVDEVMIFDRELSAAEVRTIYESAPPAPAAAAKDALVLWNSLDSEDEVKRSRVGPGGKLTGGRFVQGRFGKGIELNMQEQSGVTFPVEVVSGPDGCVEVWARLVGFPNGLAWGAQPGLVFADDGKSTEHYMLLHFNGNDGQSNGGLCAGMPGLSDAGTGNYGQWTYARALGSDTVGDWHHYAMVWASEGIPGVENGKRTVAAYVDGKLNSTVWHGSNGNSRRPMAATARFGLLYHQRMAQGSVIFDDIKVWNYAKTDFSDRFDERGR